MAKQLDLLTEIPVIDLARVAQIRDHARERRAYCDVHGDYWAGECWKAIEAVCRELDPVGA